MNIINHFVPLWNGNKWHTVWFGSAVMRLVTSLKVLRDVRLVAASLTESTPQIPQAYPTHPTHPTPNMRDKSRYAVNCFIMFHNVSYMFIWQHVHSTSGRIWMNLVGGLERFRINDSYHDRISDGLVDGWLWDAMSQNPGTGTRE